MTVTSAGAVVLGLGRLIAAAAREGANFLPWVSTPFRSFFGADILIGALVALFAIHDFASMNDRIGDNQYVSVGIGLYLTAGAGIVLAFGGVAFRAGEGALATSPAAAPWPPAPPRSHLSRCCA